MPALDFSDQAEAIDESPEDVSSRLKRPGVTLPSGDTATVRSIGVGDDRGEWVIPTIVGGVPVSNEQAISLWKSGRNQPIGGPFKTPEEGTQYAQRFHEAEQKRITQQPLDFSSHADAVEEKPTRTEVPPEVMARLGMGTAPSPFTGRIGAPGAPEAGGTFERSPSELAAGQFIGEQPGTAALAAAEAPFSALTAAGGLAYHTAADVISKLRGEPEYGGNIRAMHEGAEQLPVSKFLAKAAEVVPVDTTINKLAKSTAELSPMLGLAAAPAAINRILAIAFGLKMVGDAPGVVNGLLDEWRKPSSERDSDKITTLINEGIQIGALAPLALAHGIRGTKPTGATPNAIQPEAAPILRPVREESIQGAREVPAETPSGKAYEGGREAPEAAQPEILLTKPTATETTPPVPAAGIPKTPTETGVTGKISFQTLDEPSGEWQPTERPYVISKSTIPGSKEWRMTVFGGPPDAPVPIGHIELDSPKVLPTSDLRDLAEQLGRYTRNYKISDYRMQSERRYVYEPAKPPVESTREAPPIEVTPEAPSAGAAEKVVPATLEPAITETTTVGEKAQPSDKLTYDKPIKPETAIELQTPEEVSASEIQKLATSHLGELSKISPKVLAFDLSEWTSNAKSEAQGIPGVFAHVPEGTDKFIVEFPAGTRPQEAIQSLVQAIRQGDGPGSDWLPLSQSDAIKAAFRAGRPVLADAANQHGIKPPRGYIESGGIYRRMDRKAQGPTRDVGTNKTKGGIEKPKEPLTPPPAAPITGEQAAGVETVPTEAVKGKGYSIDFESASGDRIKLRVTSEKYSDLSDEAKAMVDRAYKTTLEFNEPEFEKWGKIKQGKSKVTVTERIEGSGQSRQSVTLDSPEVEFGRWATRDDLYDSKLNEPGQALRNKLLSQREAEAKAKSDKEAADRAEYERKSKEFQDYKDVISQTPLPTGKKFSLTVTNKEGVQSQINGTRYGDWFIHKVAGGSRRYSEPTVYKVSHVPSGLGISDKGLPTLEQAKNYIRALIHAKVRTDWKQASDLSKSEHDAIIQVGKAWVAGGDVPDYFKATRPSASTTGGELQMAFVPGAKEFFEQDVVPAATTAAQTLKETASQTKALLAPAAVSPESRLGAGIIRERRAELAQKDLQAREQFAKAKRQMDGLSPQASLAFIDRVERGAPQPNAEMTRLATDLRQAFDKRVAQVRAVNPKALQHLIQDYFPHIWKDPTAAMSWYARILGRRPLRGPASFLKQRTIPTTADGVAAGLTPVSWNPIELSLLKFHEMDRYVMGQQIFKEFKDKGLAQFSRSDIPPDGFAKIDDRIANVVEYRPTTKVSGAPGAKERILRGHWFVQQDAARVLNNFLSPGLERYKWFRALRWFGNTLNMAQLGLSGYHFTFTMIDSGTSKLSLGIEQATQGKLKGAATMARGVAGTVLANQLEYYVKGSKVLREYTKPGSVGGDYAKIVDALLAAGGRTEMPKIFKNSSLENFFTAARTGNYPGAVLRAPFAAIEAVSYPLMQNIVPRLKLGAFSDMALHEIERLGPNVSRDQFRAEMGKIWDSIDNRMGELVYDNLFWNRTLKDLSFVAVRAVGWNLGTLRELGGGMVDTAKLVGRIQRGEPVVTKRMAYLVALPITVGFMGALYQKLRTGQNPENLRDYYYPKTGNTLPDGTPERVNFPSYLKDIGSYSRHPLTTVGHKLHPTWSMVIDMLNNKDFYGTQIRNPDDPLVKQVGQEAAFIARTYLPFSVRGAQRRVGAKESTETKAESFFGVMPISPEIARTAAQNKIMEYAVRRMPQGARTPEEQARHEFNKDMDLLVQSPADYAAAQRKLLEAQRRGELSRGQRLYQQNKLQFERLQMEQGKTKSQAQWLWRFRHLTADEMQHVYDMATPQEKALFDRTLKLKLQNAR